MRVYDPTGVGAHINGLEETICLIRRRPRIDGTIQGSTQHQSTLAWAAPCHEGAAERHANHR